MSAEAAFRKLARSTFRSRFHLSDADRRYIAEKGLDTVRRHAEDFVRTRLAPANPPNDGRQTPMRGHPVFVAQHATATCCRGCLEKWWRVPKGTDIPPERQVRLVDFLMAWIVRELRHGIPVAVQCPECRTIFRWHYQTPSGFSDIVATSDGEALTGLHFAGSDSADRWARDGKARALPIFRETCRWLDIYFSGRPPDLTPAYRIEALTPFRRDVVDEMLKIPFGETVTYGDIAAAIARRHGLDRMSAQAVGGAVGWNPICLIIPCHRVIGTNGRLVGYGGGIENKIALLALEGHNLTRF